MVGLYDDDYSINSSNDIFDLRERLEFERELRLLSREGRNRNVETELELKLEGRIQQLLDEKRQAKK